MIEACSQTANGKIFSFHSYLNGVVQFYKRKLTQNQSNSGVSMETSGKKRPVKTDLVSAMCQGDGVESNLVTDIVFAIRGISSLV